MTTTYDDDIIARALAAVDAAPDAPELLDTKRRLALAMEVVPQLEADLRVALAEGETAAFAEARRRMQDPKLARYATIQRLLGRRNSPFYPRSDSATWLLEQIEALTESLPRGLSGLRKLHERVVAGAVPLPELPRAEQRIVADLKIERDGTEALRGFHAQLRGVVAAIEQRLRDSGEVPTPEPATFAVSTPKPEPQRRAAASLSS
jgi:hypothetical protein